MLFITCTKTNYIKYRTRSSMQLFLKSHFCMGLLPYICCIFAGETFDEKLCGTASEDNSFVQVNCKNCFYKLK